MTDAEPSPRNTGKSPNRCWFRIGVWGSGACEDLSHFVHCFNCPIYQEAGKSLFDRKPPVGYLEEMGTVLRSPLKASRVVRGSFLVFSLHETHFAISADVVRAVTPFSDIHSVPFRSDNLFLGLSPVRGKLRLCYSLGKVLGGPCAASSDAGFRRMLLMGEPDLSFVFPVTDVDGLMLINEESMEREVSSLDGAWIVGVTHFDGKVIHVLNGKSIMDTFSEKQL